MSAAVALNPVQHGFVGILAVKLAGSYGLPCRECGAPIDDQANRPRRGPRSKMHQACRRIHRRRAQLRAYLASAARIADELGDDVAADAIRRVPVQLSFGELK